MLAALSSSVLLLSSLTTWPTAPAAVRIVQAGNVPLASAEATGSKRFSSDQIVAATGLQKGSPVKREDLQAAADRLAQLGEFATVQYRFSSVEAGVKVEYQVTDAPAVPVLFDNFPWFAADELSAALKNSVVLFDGQAPEGGAILDAMSGALEKLLETRGVHARVSHTLTTASGNDQRIQVFRVEGAALNVEGIEFTDALAKNDRGIRELAASLVGKPFSRDAIELFEAEHVRPLYLAQAHVRVQFGEPRARFTGNPNKPLPDTVLVIAPINPGPAYSWDGVSWNGNAAIASKDLTQLLGLRIGEPADGVKIEGGWERALEAYSHIGYLDASLSKEARYDDANHRIAYRVSVKEGPQYHMGDLVLSGLSLEGERRIRSAWKIPAGAVFDQGLFETFLEFGAKQAFVGLPFHYEKIGRWLEKHPQTGVVNVLLDFQ